MSLSDKLDTAYIEITQGQQVSKARALIQPIRDDIVRINAELQVIADSGVFNTVDTDIKQALVAAWNIIKAAETAFEDETVKELLDWKP